MMNGFPKETEMVMKMTGVILQEKKLSLADRMSTRLVKCAAAMEPDEMIGWQMLVPVKGLTSLSVFGSAGCSREDLAWTVEKVAKTAKQKWGRKKDGSDSLKELYEISLPAASSSGQSRGIGFCPQDPGKRADTSDSEEASHIPPSWPVYFTDQFPELVTALREGGGMLRTVLGAASPEKMQKCRQTVLRSLPLKREEAREYIGSPVRIRVLLRLPARPSIRLRTVISQAVPGTRLCRLGSMDEADVSQIWEDPLAGACTVPDLAARMMVMEPLLRERVVGIDSVEAEPAILPASHKNTKAKKKVTVGKAVNLAGLLQKITIGDMDLRRHYQIVGQTGTGKSTLLIILILSAIQEGYGLTFFDPHGTTIDRILRLVPEKYAAKIRVVRLGDADHPVPLGIWDSADPVKEERNISDLCELFADIFDPNREGIVGPRYERWLSTMAKASLLLLGRKASLESIAVLSRSRENMRKLIDAIKDKDPDLAEIITQEYVMDRSSDFNSILAWFLCKFERLTSVKQIRQTLGAGTNALDFPDTIDKDTVTLIDLASPEIGTNAARIAGTLTLMKLWNAALERKNRDKTHLVILDEASLFQTNPLPRMLAEGRKFGVSMVLCHQHTGQLTREVREALEANSANFSAFRLSVKDAAEAAYRFDDPALQTGLARLNAFCAVTTLSVDGKQTPPFTMQIEKPASSKNGGEIAARITQTSIKTLVDAYHEQRALTPAQIQDCLDHPEKYELGNEGQKMMQVLQESFDELLMGDANFIEEDFDEGPAAWREIPLKDLHLTLRSYNCLRRAGICTLGQLAACRSLSGIRNLNRECRKEIAERVLEYLPPEEICFLQELDEEIIKDIIPDAV